MEAAKVGSNAPRLIPPSPFYVVKPRQDANFLHHRHHHLFLLLCSCFLQVSDPCNAISLCISGETSGEPILAQISNPSTCAVVENGNRRGDEFTGCTGCSIPSSPYLEYEYGSPKKSYTSDGVLFGLPIPMLNAMHLESLLQFLMFQLPSTLSLRVPSRVSSASLVKPFPDSVQET